MAIRNNILFLMYRKHTNLVKVIRINCGLNPKNCKIYASR